MKTNIEVVENCIKLIGDLRGFNKKLRVQVLETNYLTETRLYFIVGFNLIGKALFNGDEINTVVKMVEDLGHDVPVDSLEDTCYIDKESENVDNWCFEVEDGTLFKKMKISKPKRTDFEDYKKSLESEVGEFSELHPNLDEVLQTPITKNGLEEQRVIIFENSPVTNTVCLSKDFKLERHHTIRSIEEILSLYPYMLNDVSVGFYENDKNIGKHYIIQEPVYVKFLELLPKDSGVNPFKRIKLRDAYYEAFSKMREWFYNQNFKEEEIRDIMSSDKDTTSLLITKLEIKFNEGRVSKTTQHELMRAIFNHINFRLGLDSMSYNYSTNNRENLSPQKQKELQWLETVAIDAVIGVQWSRHMVGQLNMYLNEITPFTVVVDFYDWQRDIPYRSDVFKSWTFRNPYKVNDMHALRLYEELMSY